MSSPKNQSGSQVRHPLCVILCTKDATTRSPQTLRSNVRSPARATLPALCIPRFAARTSGMCTPLAPRMPCSPSFECPQTRKDPWSQYHLPQSSSPVPFTPVVRAGSSSAANAAWPPEPQTLPFDHYIRPFLRRCVQSLGPLHLQEDECSICEALCYFSGMLL